MHKAIAQLTEIVAKEKRPFRQVDARPTKPLKNRYARRKVREYLRAVTYSGIGDGGGTDSMGEDGKEDFPN